LDVWIRFAQPEAGSEVIANHRHDDNTSSDRPVYDDGKAEPAIERPFRNAAQIGREHV
jgi:hypothetical protein